MEEDHRGMLVDSVCNIDAWSKGGTISRDVADKFQQVTSAFYWMTNEHDKLNTKLEQENAKALHYKSTACYHEQHGNCRLQCKFCTEQCSCQCHTQIERETRTLPTYQALEQENQRLRRHKTLNDLSRTEKEQGTYDRIPE